jgi:hypothetical protein
VPLLHPGDRLAGKPDVLAMPIRPNATVRFDFLDVEVKSRGIGPDYVALDVQYFGSDLTGEIPGPLGGQLSGNPLTGHGHGRFEGLVGVARTEYANERKRAAANHSDIGACGES